MKDETLLKGNSVLVKKVDNNIIRKSKIIKIIKFSEVKEEELMFFGDYKEWGCRLFLPGWPVIVPQREI